MQERESTIPKMLINTGNRHIITRAIITEDCTDDGKSFQHLNVLFFYPNRQQDEITFYQILPKYSC